MKHRLNTDRRTAGIREHEITRIENPGHPRRSADLPVSIRISSVFHPWLSLAALIIPGRTSRVKKHHFTRRQLQSSITTDGFSVTSWDKMAGMKAVSRGR
jgi:hypothetical protein